MKNNKIYTFLLAILVFLSLVFIYHQVWGAALGTGFFALIIWNNKLRS